MDDTSKARIRTYLAQHQATYDHAALRQKLIADGFEPGDVDEVLAELNLASPSQPRRQRFRLWLVYLGLLVFVPLNLVGLRFLTIDIGPGVPADPGLSQTYDALIFAGVVLGLSALAFLLRRRDFAAGLLAGYVLMTIASGGSCTFLNPNPSSDGAFMGFYLYPIMLLVIGVFFGIVALFINRK